MNFKSLFPRKSFLSRRRSVFFFWLLSYVFILLIPVTFCGAVYFIASDEIEDEIHRSSIAMLKQMQIAIDSTLSEAQRLSINIANNRKVFKVAGFTEPIQSSEQYVVAELVTELKGYNLTSGCINGFYVYFKESDTVISPVTFGTSLSMYDALGYPRQILYDQWHEMLRQQHTMHCIPLASADEAGRSGRMVAFLQSIPINAPLQPLGTVVVLIDESKLMEMARSIHGANTGDVFIINKNNDMLAATKAYTDGRLPDYEELPGESGILYREWDGKRNTLFYITSEISKLKYIEVVPQSVALQRSEKIRRIMFASIILCLVTGGIGSIVLAIKNYNPVKELLKLLGDNNPLNISRQHNEYHFIQEVLRNTLHEKERLSKKIGEQNLSFRTSFIEKLLKGRIEHKENITDILSSMDICFHSECFAVMLFYIEDFGDIFREMEGEDRKEGAETIKFVFKNVVEEISGQNHLGIMTEADDMMACLVNFKPEGMENAEQELERIAQEALAFIGHKLHIHFTVSISRVHQMLSGIQEAWEEANEAMEFRVVEGSGKLIRYADIKISSQNYYYPMEMEYKLVNCMKVGDSFSANKIINDIFDENFSKGTPSVQLAKCLMYDLIGTIIKTTEELGGTYSNLSPDETNPIGKLLNCQTIPGMKKLMTGILVQVCEKIQTGKKSGSSSMSDRIMEFIKQNFHDANLGLSMIAEHFEITPTYVSRIFKEQTGEGILDYINRVRLETAKQLLKEGELNISTVAEKVGYTGSRALIRLFKKYEGVTPGKFKEI